MLKYELVEINKDHFVKVLKCPAQNVKNTIICIIPGNPGVVEFYEKLAMDLNESTGLEVIAISHTGHFYDKNLKAWPPLDLTGQINDKVKYLNEFVFNNKQTNIIFIGHSIGCYVILQMLSKLEKDQRKLVKRAILLFPTIERMSETPNGKILTFFTRFFLWLMYFFAFLVTFLPQGVQKKLVNDLFAKRHSNDDLCHNISETVLGMSTSFSCVRSCFHMGKHEMNEVGKLDDNLIKENLDLLVLYYGMRDKWCPVEYYFDMQNFLSGLDGQGGEEDEEKEKKNIPTLVLDNYELEHAFVIYKKQCSIVAKMVTKWTELSLIEN